jgi:hypothetical protein
MGRKLECWQSKLLPIGGRVTLLNSFLSNLPIHMMSFYGLPVGVCVCVCDKFGVFRKRLLWQEELGSRKLHLVNWDTVLPKL